MMMEKEQTKVSFFDFDKSLMMMMMEKEQTKVSFSNFDKSLDDDDDDGKGTNKGL